MMDGAHVVNAVPSPRRGEEEALMPRSSVSEDSELLGVQSLSDGLEQSGSQASAVSTNENPPTEDKHRTATKKQSDHKPFLQLSSWWWWEIGATFLSMISMVLMVPVLVKLDNMLIEDWNYNFRPTTVLSILTTITKTTLLVPVAACLSQMKWDHFEYRAAPLDHLQLYDDASRGPWGSFLLLVTGRAKVLTAWAFAIITLVTLGMDPSTQQMLETRLTEAELPNATALIGAAHNYTSKGFTSSEFYDYMGSPHTPNLFTLQLQTSILNGAAGSPSIVEFDCPEPATRCVWAEFDTLEVCGTFTNATSMYERRCDAPDYFDPDDLDLYTIDCAYDLPQNKSIGLYLGPGADEGLTLFNSTSIWDSDTNSWTLWAVKTMDAFEAGGFQNTTEIYTMSWRWCKKTFHEQTASPVGLHASNFTEEDLVDFSTFGGYGDLPAGYNLFYRYYQVPGDTSWDFNISSSVDDGLFTYVTRLLSRQLQSATRQGEIADDLNLAEFMFLTDLANMTQNIAATLTAQLRSADKDNLAATMVTGQVWYTVTFYSVRWPWIVVSVTEVVAATILLVISIVLTRRQPLIKASSMGLLVFGLQGWTDEELQGVGSTDLDGISKSMWARFGRNQDGYLKFQKHQL